MTLRGINIIKQTKRLLKETTTMLTRQIRNFKQINMNFRPTYRQQFRSHDIFSEAICVSYVYVSHLTSKQCCYLFVDIIITSCDFFTKRLYCVYICRTCSNLLFSHHNYIMCFSNNGSYDCSIIVNVSHRVSLAPTCFASDQNYTMRFPKQNKKREKKGTLILL